MGLSIAVTTDESATVTMVASVDGEVALEVKVRLPANPTKNMYAVALRKLADALADWKEE